MTVGTSYFYTLNVLYNRKCWTFFLKSFFPYKSSMVMRKWQLLILLKPWPTWLSLPSIHTRSLIAAVAMPLLLILLLKMQTRAYCIWLKSSLIPVEGDDWEWWAAKCWEEVLCCHPLQWFGFLCCNIGQWGVTVEYWGLNRELWFSMSRLNKLHPSVLITSKELEWAHISTTDRDNETLWC